MPSYYEQPASFQNAVTEDINRFQKLPFYLVKNEVKVFPQWNVFDQLFGSIPWQANMGNTMRAVTPQPSPVGQSMFFPNNIDTQANKNVYTVGESSEDARIKAHDYQSQQFSFIPSFQNFWSNYLQYCNSDIARQIAVSNNIFIRTNLWYKSPNVYIAGVGLTAAPTADGNAAGTAANSKTTAWMAAQLATVANNLSLRTIERASLSLIEDMGAPAFDGVKNMPKDNEGLKGKYVLVGSTEAWSMFPYDKDTQLLKSINLDLLFNDFNGLLMGKTTFKYDRYPLRCGADGVFVAPEVYNADTKKSIPNPAYTSLVTSPFEVAFLLGADACKTIKVGPPPKEFAAQSMASKKFYSLKWNGEIQLTDQVLVTYADGTVDLNVYGQQLKFIAKTTHGYLPCEPRFAMPILFRRARPVEVQA